jgi:hypothetical protein
VICIDASVAAMLTFVNEYSSQARALVQRLSLERNAYALRSAAHEGTGLFH